MKDFKFGDFQATSGTGLDAFFESEPSIVSPFGQEKTASAPKTSHKVRVASLQQLEGFSRTSAHTLVNKSTRDLWAIQKDGEEFVIARLFQDDGQPLKG